MRKYLSFFVVIFMCFVKKRREKCPETCSLFFISAAVLYVGGRPVAKTEHVGVHVFILHLAGQT